MGNLLYRLRDQTAGLKHCRPVRGHDKRAPHAPFADCKKPVKGLEISATLRVTTIAIEFNSLAGALARSAAVFSVRLRWTSANRILALLILIVGHRIPPEVGLKLGA